MTQKDISYYNPHTQQWETPFAHGADMVQLAQTVSNLSQTTNEKITEVTEHLAQNNSQLVDVVTKIDSKQYEHKTYYNEQFRPQFHFSPEFGFMNDPNGLVWIDGEFHLYYQCEPNQLQAGAPSWGHAVSKDLKHWEHQPIALFKEDNAYMWSGSCVVDTNNTAGFGTNTLIALYTIFEPSTTVQSIGLAYSTDKGRTFTKYSGNPIMPPSMAPGNDPHQWRDPKVFWDDSQSKWVMAITAQFQIAFYASSDLKTWTYLSKFTTPEYPNTVIECPNLVKLNLDGVSDKWALIVSVNNRVVYWLGDWDGTTFTADNANAGAFLDAGFDFYAIQVWDNLPNGDVYGIAWANNWTYSENIDFNPFNGVNTLPRKLTLKTVNGVQKIVQEPVDLEDISVTLSSYSNSQLEGLVELGKGASLHVEASFDLTDTTATSIGFNVMRSTFEHMTIEYNTMTNTLSLNRGSLGNIAMFEGYRGNVAGCTVMPINNKIKLDIYIDRSIVEVFANDGEETITALAFPYEESNKVEVFADNPVKLEYANVYVVQSVWSELEEINKNLTELNKFLSDFNNADFLREHIGVVMTNNPSVRAYTPSPITTVNAIDNFVPFGATDYDTQNMHDIANPTRITFKEQGRYLINVSVVFQPNNDGFREIALRVNGNEFLESVNSLALPNWATSLCLTTVHIFSPSDFVEVNIFQNSGADIGATVKMTATKIL